MAVGRDLGASDDSRLWRAPQLGGRSVGKLPYSIARALRGHVQQITRAQSRRESTAGWQGDGRRCRRVDRRVSDGQSPQRSHWISKCRHKASTVSARRKRGIPVETGAHPARYATLDIHTVQPRAGAVPIAGEVHQPPAIQQNGMTDARVLVRDSFNVSPGWTDAPDVHRIG